MGGRDSSSRSDSSSKSNGSRRSTDRDIKNGRSLGDVLSRAGSRGSNAPTRSFEPPGDTARPARRQVQYQPVMSFQAPPPDTEKTGAEKSGTEKASLDKFSRPPSTKTFRPVFQPPVEVPTESRSKKENEIAKGTRGPAVASGPEAVGVRGASPIQPVTPTGKSPINSSNSSRSDLRAASPLGQVARSNEPVDPGWPRARVIGTGATTDSSGALALKPARSGEPRTSRDARRDGNRLMVTGTVKRHPDGFGFLIPEDASLPDIYVSRQYMAGVMTNDRVEAEVFRARPMDRGSSSADRLFGEVKRIISRAHSRIVGRFLPVDRRYGVIQDDGRGWGMDLRIATEDSQGAEEGDWVAVEIIDYASNDRPLSGRVIRVLGDVDDPLNDVIRVVHEKGIPDEFSFSARREAGSLGTEVSEADIAGREDLRNIPLITIDGSTARDFDDAVYVEQSPNGFRVLVAIADVSAYVKPGGSIDEDAYSRGTSTYFPNYVVPMLPEELSNELCSLKPDVNRLCFCCEMQLDFQGAIQKYRFFEGVMKSKARVTYGEAQEVIDGEPSARLQEIKGVCENILRSADLAKILMAKRFREGSLDLEIPETQVVVDSSGETIDVVRTERLFAHRLIEELMLLTNIATARFFEDNRIHGIYRIHEEPDPDNIKTVEKMLWNLLGPGRGKLGPGEGLQKKLTKALQAAKSTPGGQVLNVLTLRAMNQAKYSSDNVGHFGLGFSHYSHFTSPIRRYPDLIAHRLIKAVLYPRYRNQGMEIEEISSAATHLSSCEQRSVKAERAVISIKKARFIRRYVGEILEGSVTSIAKFGIFVTLREFEIDGLVKLESLGPDRWVFDDQNMRLYGRRTGRVFKLGDVLNVMVQSSDLATGKIDFSLEDEGTQVEEALVVLGDEMEVEELAERAEEMLSQKARGDSRAKRGRSRAAKGAARAAAGTAKPAKSPIKPIEPKAKAGPAKSKKKSNGRRGGSRR
ncbi:MAG: ribonuclease R [Deltaproteobacteria bacterium]|nr:ribonuclease R [Deltaproteobacteria bacterium]